MSPIEILTATFPIFNLQVSLQRPQQKYPHMPICLEVGEQKAQNSLAFCFFNRNETFLACAAGLSSTSAATPVCKIMKTDQLQLVSLSKMIRAAFFQAVIGQGSAASWLRRTFHAEQQKIDGRLLRSLDSLHSFTRSSWKPESQFISFSGLWVQFSRWGLRTQIYVVNYSLIDREMYFRIGESYLAQLAQHT